MKLSFKEDIAYISFGRNKRNTLTTSCFNKLSSILTELKAKDVKPRAIVLESSVDDVFSYGADPEFFASLDLQGKKELFVSLMNSCKAALSCHIPIIVDLRGPAKAGGAILAALSDFAVSCERDAVLSFSEVKVGIPIPHCLYKIVERRISASHFSEMMLLGKNVNAKELSEIGFSNACYFGSNKKEAFESVFSKIRRIDQEVMAYSIKARNHGIIDTINSYIANFDEDFLHFLDVKHTVSSFKKLEKL